jgi:hypothetical protein
MPNNNDRRPTYWEQQRLDAEREIQRREQEERVRSLQTRITAREAEERINAASLSYTWEDYERHIRRENERMREIRRRELYQAMTSTEAVPANSTWGQFRPDTFGWFSESVVVEKKPMTKLENEIFALKTMGYRRG